MSVTNGDIEEAYLSAVVGKNTPNLGVFSGGLINKTMGTDIYDEKKMYIVSPKGISEVVPEDESD